MSSEFDGMTDAELTDMINADDSANGEDTAPVSPTMEESEEQSTDSEEDNDVGQSSEPMANSLGDSTMNEQTDDNSQETLDEEDESSDDDTEEGEDTTTEVGDEAESLTQFQPLKANGKEYPIDNIDELYKLASAGVGATQKFQAIAGHRKSIMAAEKAGVDLMGAVNFQANLKENPQEAVMNLLKEVGIDPLDLDMDSDVKSNKDYSVTDFEVKYDEIVGEIGNSPKFKDVQDVLTKQWDETSRNVFFDKPEMIKQLHDEMLPLEGSDKSMFDLVSPIAEKMKLSGDTRSDLDVYMDARAIKLKEFAKYETTKQTTKPKSKVASKQKKKSASPTQGKSVGKVATDFASMSDDELDAFLSKTN